MSREKPAPGPDRNRIMDTLKVFRGGGGSAPQGTPPTGTGAYPIPPSRQRRKAVTTWQDELALKQLKDLANEKGKNEQALLAEALNLLFVRHEKPPIAN